MTSTRGVRGARPGTDTVTGVHNAEVGKLIALYPDTTIEQAAVCRRQAHDTVNTVRQLDSDGRRPERRHTA